MTKTLTDILTHPQFAPSECVKVSEEESTEVINALHAALKEANSQKITGIGLSAPQIGINKSVFVYHLPDEDGAVYARSFSNPVICELKKPVRFSGEGCLSFPGDSCETLRYAECKVLSLEDPQGVHLVGMSAIVAQHETDHLLGLTMFDRKITNIGPNTKCPCGSLKKFKKCCSNEVKDFAIVNNSLDVKF
jgi:peptide deformylase